MKKFLFIILFLPIIVFSQSTITGTVKDSQGNYLKDVLVEIKDFKISTKTNANGFYTLKNVPQNASSIIFSKKDYETAEFTINGQTKIDCELYLLTEIITIIDENISVDFAEVEESIVSYDKIAVTTGINNGSFDDGPSTEEYSNIVENVFKDVFQNPVSTMSIDVDNASYSNVRRFLTYGEMPPNDAVRIEEMINYFDYDYPAPKGDEPFSVITEVSDAPWNSEHKLVHIGIQGKKLDYENLKPSNFVFLIDVSGSMSDPNKLPLAIEGLKLLVNELSNKDKVAIVVYAGAAGEVLSSTPANQKEKIFSALDKLQAGGSTAGGEGIVLAYNIAQKNLIQGGNNRVILLSDGDFNVGTSSTGALVDLITEFRQKYDIYLTICGLGMGNYKDDKMEQISNAGNGNYFYIDNKDEAEKVFVKDFRANMFTIAKDVKIQIEFNPAEVQSYRLIGYENRVLANEDFNDDKKDAGELGAGHTVTAIYEIVPVKTKENIIKSDELKYQKIGLTNEAASGELFTLKLRYKPINSEKSILSEYSFNKKNIVSIEKSSANFKFSAAVAAFGMLLRDSKFIDKSKYSYDNIIELTKQSYKKDDKYQVEFLYLVEKAKELSKK